MIQLGRETSRIVSFRGLGIGNVLRLKLLSREELEEALDFKLAPRNLLITFHPVTLERGTRGQQLDELLAALAELPDNSLIFTMPNADTEGRLLIFPTGSRYLSKLVDWR